MSSAPSYVTTYPAGTTITDVGATFTNFPVVVASSPISALVTASQTSVVTYTPTAAGVYKVGGVITNGTATNTGTTILEVTYTDSFGTTHTGDVIPLIAAAGTVTLSGATGASTEWKSVPVTITSGATAITVKTVVSGSVSYTVAAFIST